MKNFKLIAVLPLKGCDAAFSKNLIHGYRYQFFHQYEIGLNDDSSTVEYAQLRKATKVPEKLYRLKNGISVNFSAVVGKNGSGKSTLFELLYYVIYFLGTRPDPGQEPILEKPVAKLDKKFTMISRDLAKLKDYIEAGKATGSAIIEVDSEKVDIDLFVHKLIQKYDLEINTDKAKVNLKMRDLVINNLTNRLADLKGEIESEASKDKSLDTGLHVSVIYAVDGDVREIYCHNGTVYHNRLFGKNTSKTTIATGSNNLHELFYTISLNYSHHSLNSKSIGKWINSLFHKNDGYKTPVVINPMREEGNFDINRELKLSKERLMSTLVFDLLQSGKRMLLGKYEVSSFIFIPKSASTKQVGIPGEFDQLESADILKKILGITHLDYTVPYGELAINYLNDKISKVSENYPFLFSGAADLSAEIEGFTKDDQSHITKKIRQSLNYVRVSNQPKHLDIWGNSDGLGPIVLTPQQLKDYIALFKVQTEKLGPAELIDYALPGFFNVDFEFIDRTGKTILLSAMSSGEQQILFNINSILYHLYNLQSVHQQAGGSPRPAYKHVNIILDEVELYYHPDMQRKLVNDLMTSFELLKKGGGIESLNVCILTHSPFILSDIPVQQTLRLGQENQGSTYPTSKQTFAANIHDLLREDFLLRDGFMGAYATVMINALIDSMKAHTIFAAEEKKASNTLTLKRKKTLLKQNFYQASYLPEDILSRQEIEERIALVGEPVLYQSLMTLYAETFPNSKTAFIRGQIALLNKLINNGGTQS